MTPYADPGDELPTLPGRGYSGTEIKGPVIKAMSDQLAAERLCVQELDRLMVAIRIADSVPPPQRGEVVGSCRLALDSVVH